MPNGMAFDDAVQIASGAPGLGVGIHLSLVDEHCVAPAGELGGLVDESGMLPASYEAFVKSYLLRRFGLREVRAEIEAQIGRVLAAGIRPTHIDSHQHLHVFPGISSVVIDAAKSVGIGVIRIPMECGGIGARGYQQKVLAFLCRRTSARARRAGMRHPDHFWGFGVSGHMNEANLSQILDRLRPGVNEIMCHPGFGNPLIESRYRWNYDWDDEAAALRSESVRRIIDDRKIRLASFADAL
jgi:predicted glycoside hydrolase/deacetylase ChbG (UPF0249 family)